MRNIWIIFRRELAAYFTSPIAYFVAFAVLILLGFVFNTDLTDRNGRLATDGGVVAIFLGQFSVIFAPLLTMRLLAEEKREGTLELLMTLPLSDYQIVIGKFLAAWAYYSILMLLTVVHQITLIWLSPPDLGVVIASYLGVWLLGGASLAVGLFFSALNENQVVAAFLGMSTLLILWQASQVGDVISNRAIAVFVRGLSFQANFSDSFAIGIARLDHMVFFIGVIAVVLLATTQIVESRRWR
ncbi:MAG: ABC transporter permease [Anaerolineae bacterium]